MEYPGGLQQWLSGVQKVFPAADTVVVAGPEERRFAAHRALLAAHSGHLKGLAATSTEATLVLPAVAADAFDVLLGFMYSGYLNVHQHNIYSVLSAAHVLQMPQALELCREFLLKLEQYELARKQTAALTFVFKPVATRRPLPCMVATRRVSAADGRFVLRPSAESLFKSVGAPSATPEEQPRPPSQQTPETSRAPRPTEAPKDEVKPGGRVVLDVACCDGPVRFHRVLNDDYSAEAVTGSERTDSDDENNTEDDENKQRNGRKESGECQYKCVYCNHTFKSQYCYQKHTRRHINPVSYDVLKLTAGNAREGSESGRTRLLDMNVQYYPCKSCGSKFPSYYFVHKHRKMCHPAEADADKDSKKSFKSN